jgi:unsaturated rhamnogalacturonyl hydrolase
VSPQGAGVPRERLQASAERLVEYPFRVWHYGESTGLEGLVRASRLLGEPRYEGWVHGLLRGWAARRRPFAEIDNTLPGKVLCELAARHDDELLMEAALDAAEHLMARRTVRGVALPFDRAPLQAPFGGGVMAAVDLELLEDPGPGVFVDPLHFDPPFLVRLGRMVGAPALVDAGAAQALALTDLLQDESGLFWHFFLERSGERYGLGWGRGQGWALLGLVDVLEALPPEHTGHAPLRRALERLVAALCSGQREDGGWDAVIGEPESGDESSTAAFVAAGVGGAVGAGLLPRDRLEPAGRAWSYTVARVREDGVLDGISANVFACTVASHYHHVPRGAVVPWGQGPLLLAAAAMEERGSAGA